MIHKLKTWPEDFEAIWRNVKTAEFQKNDRNFRVGDMLLLREYDPVTETCSGREMKVLIRHIQTGFGIPERYAVLSIRVECLKGEFAKW